MALKQVMEFVDEPKKSFGFSVDSVVSNDSKDVITLDSNPVPARKRGPGRPPKDSSSTANTYIGPDNFVKSNGKKSDTPEKQYEKGYSATVGILAGAIQQADDIYKNIESELANFRNNRSYGGKTRMMAMGELMNAQMGLINTKINAVRELDSIKHKINDLVMKRMQFDKEVNDENSDKAIMDAYYALVNSSQYGLTPMQAPLSPASLNTGVTMNGTSLNGSFINGASIIPANPDHKQAMQDQSFNDYKANLTPIQRKMILDNDPNIKTVVVYDQGSGRKYFDVVNVQTGQSVPGVPRPAEFLLDSMRIDARNGIASNSNVNQSYPLVITGTRIADEL